MDDQVTKNCPFCAEEIKAAAIKCKHCGSMLDGSDPPEVVLPAQPPPGYVNVQAAGMKRPSSQGTGLKVIGSLLVMGGTVGIVAMSTSSGSGGGGAGAFGIVAFVVGLVLFVVGRFYD